MIGRSRIKLYLDFTSVDRNSEGSKNWTDKLVERTQENDIEKWWNTIT